METNFKFEDPLDEIYAIREKISAEYGHDITRFINAMREQYRDVGALGFKLASMPIVKPHIKRYSA